MSHATINNMQLYYELKGKESGECVLFLHGLGSSSRDWERQVPPLLAEYRVLLVDVRGHGKSDKPAGPYSVPQFTRDIVALLDQLKIDRVHLVGLSMGGMIGFQLAADFQQRLLSMVIINSGPALIPRTLKEKSNIWLRFFIVRALGMQKMGETLAKRLFVDPDQEALRQTFVQRWTENDPRAYMDAMRAIVGWGVEDSLPQITVPTLIIAADQDYTPVASKEAYIARMPNATLEVIPNAHHAVSAERPDAVNALIGRFIRQHTTARAHA